MCGLYILNKANWKLSVAAVSFGQPVMTTPKGTSLPQQSFFHTPVSLSPLAAVVTSGGHSTSKTVYIPQRKLDVSTEDSWRPGRPSCVVVVWDAFMGITFVLVLYWCFSLLLMAGLVFSLSCMWKIQEVTQHFIADSSPSAHHRQLQK